MLALPPANGWNNLLKRNPGEWCQPQEGKAEGVNARGSPQISWVTKTTRGAGVELRRWCSSWTERIKTSRALGGCRKVVVWCIWESPWIACTWDGGHGESSGGLAVVVLLGCCFSPSCHVGCGTPPGEAEGCVPKSAAVRAGASSTGHFPSLSTASSECVLILPEFHIKSPGCHFAFQITSLGSSSTENPQPVLSRRTMHLAVEEMPASGRCSGMLVAFAGGFPSRLQPPTSPGPGQEPQLPALPRVLASGWVRGLLLSFLRARLQPWHRFQQLPSCWWLFPWR